jgi:hypothetical protein
MLSIEDMFFVGHLWIPGKDVRGSATENPNSEIHFAGKWLFTIL